MVLVSILEISKAVSIAWDISINFTYFLTKSCLGQFYKEQGQGALIISLWNILTKECHVLERTAPFQMFSSRILIEIWCRSASQYLRCDVSLRSEVTSHRRVVHIHYSLLHLLKSFRERFSLFWTYFHNIVILILFVLCASFIEDVKYICVLISVDLWNKPGIYVEQKPTKTRRRSKVYKNVFIGKKPFELLFSPIIKYTF